MIILHTSRLRVLENSYIKLFIAHLWALRTGEWSDFNSFSSLPGSESCGVASQLNIFSAILGLIFWRIFTHEDVGCVREVIEARDED